MSTVADAQVPTAAVEAPSRRGIANLLLVFGPTHGGVIDSTER